MQLILAFLPSSLSQTLAHMICCRFRGARSWRRVLPELYPALSLNVSGNLAGVFLHLWFFSEISIAPQAFCFLAIIAYFPFPKLFSPPVVPLFDLECYRKFSIFLSNKLYFQQVSSLTAIFVAESFLSFQTMTFFLLSLSFGSPFQDFLSPQQGEYSRLQGH